MDTIYAKIYETEEVGHFEVDEDYEVITTPDGRKYSSEEWVPLWDDGTEMSDDDKLSLTPYSCFLLAISDTEIDGDIHIFEGKKPKARKCFDLFEKRAKEAGAIKDKGEEDNGKQCSTEELKNIFVKTVNGFYPQTNLDQREAAFDLFIENMEKQDLINRTEN